MKKQAKKILLLIISFALVGIIRAQNNIQVSVNGGTLYSKAIIVGTEIGIYDSDGTKTVYSLEENTEPYQIYLNNWVVTFETDTSKSRYELNKLAEFSVKDGISTIRYGAVFYGVFADYKPANCQVKLVITSKDFELLFTHERVYKKYMLSFMP
jgi:hypothetical protein